MASDYYEILGVPQSASTSDIRAAYRQRVKEYHPDTSEYIDSETIFKQLKTGYDVLGNRERRSEYNQLGHDRFVEKYGGYTRSEIRNATETQIQIQPNSQRDATGDWQAEQQQRMQEQRMADDSRSVFQRVFDLVIQGRTPSTNGTLAFGIRLCIYTLLVGVVAAPVATVLGGVGAITNSVVLFSAVLLLTRLCYLIGFEYLRDEYIKIDRDPEPDAYTIPYALALGGLALSAVGVSVGVGVLVEGEASGIESLVFAVAVLVVAVALPVSLMWAILSVGFGVADDRYNLQYDVNPVWWNFAVQSPVLVAFAAFGHLSTGYLLVICCLPFVVAAVYLVRSHREVGSEIRWRVSNGRIFASR